MTTTIQRFALVTFTLCLVAGLARQAQAQSKGRQTAEGHYQKGMKAYTLGHFPEAIEEFEKAYELRQEPIFLYNIAQSHRQNNKPDRAVFFYRRYLEADPNAKNRAEIEKRIKDMESSLTATAAPVAPPTVAPPPVPPPVVQPSPAPAPAPLPAPARVESQPSGTSPGRGLRIAGIAVGAAGVAGVATGIFLGLHANSLHDQAMSGAYDHAKDESSKTFRTLEWVSLGVGAAAMIGGGVLYYLGATAQSSSATVAVLPYAAPGTAGATVYARF